MNRRRSSSKLVLVAALLLAVGWLMTMPHGKIIPSSDFRVGTLKRPFESELVNAAHGRTPKVSLSIVRTSSLRFPEAMTMAGGSWGKFVVGNFSGFLVRHGPHVLAFDLGLGCHIEQQYETDMAYWLRLVFRYGKPVVPLKEQLARAGMPAIDEILLSHSHWDHAAGLDDFPKANVWVPLAELDYIRNMTRGSGQPWPSQVGRADIRWQILNFTTTRYQGFSRSLDLFNDGAVVAVPLPGHTPGSVGLFVRTSSGRRVLLIGDAVWNSEALKSGREKFWAARWLVDNNRDATTQSLALLTKLAHDDPTLTIIPAHDGELQSKLGYFPKWVH